MTVSYPRDWLTASGWMGRQSGTDSDKRAVSGNRVHAIFRGEQRYAERLVPNVRYELLERVCKALE